VISTETAENKKTLLMEEYLVFLYKLFKNDLNFWS